MNRIISPTNNQQGSVMALALMVMVTLTIVGLTAINDTVVESTIARNHTLYRQTLYLAEAAVRQAIQIMEDYTEDNAVTGDLMARPSVLPWMQHYLDFDFGSDVDWAALDFRGDNAVEYGVFVPTLLANGNTNASGYVARYEGIAAGSSLDMTDPTSLYQFSVFGRGVGPMRGDRTEGVVKVGYRMRY